MKQRHWIDSSKGMNAPVILGIMALYGAWDSGAAWVYLALHGTYGLLWLIKSSTFPDKQWEAECSAAYGLLIWLALGLYWISPWLICSGAVAEPPAWWIGLCVSLYGLGVFLHFASDMQKHLHLQHRPGTLLMDGLWGRLRNPNYFGELLIYGGFCLLPRHPAPVIILLLIVALAWVPNMRKKDRSLSRYPEFAAYRERSWLFIPLLW